MFFSVRRHERWTLRLLFCALLLASGCGLSALDAQSSGVEPPGCEGDGDCLSGQSCQAQRCVDNATQPLPISIELHYPDEVDQLPRQVSGLLFEPGISLVDLQAQPSIQTTIEVTRGVTNVPATVQFFKDGQIPGTRLSVWRQTGSSGANFELLPDTYQVEIRPDASTGLPPLTLTQDISADLDALTLSLPLLGEGERFIELRGQLLIQLVGESQSQPIQQARITARSVDGRFTSNTLLVCQKDDARCDGSFSGLILPAQRPDEARMYQLLVETTNETPEFPTLLLPTIEVNAALLAGAIESGDTLQVTLAQPLQALNVPKLLERKAQIIDADTGGPIVGATARVQTQAEGVAYATTTHALSDADGYVSLRVVDGQDFSLVVTPPESSDRAVLTTRIDPEVSGDDVVLTLPMFARIPVHGRVLGRDAQQLVADAEVEAIPVDDHGMKIETSSTLRSASTFSDERGDFSLNLDAGRYALSLTPPKDTGLPRRSLELVVDEARSLEVMLGRSSVVFGRILDPQGFPSAGVRVKVFRHEPGSDHADVIGEATTDGEGIYRAIVPNPDDL